MPPKFLKNFSRFSYKHKPLESPQQTSNPTRSTEANDTTSNEVIVKQEPMDDHKMVDQEISSLLNFDESFRSPTNVVDEFEYTSSSSDYSSDTDSSIQSGPIVLIERNISPSKTSENTPTTGFDLLLSHITQSQSQSQSCEQKIFNYDEVMSLSSSTSEQQPVRTALIDQNDVDYHKLLKNHKESNRKLQNQTKKSNQKSKRRKQKKRREQSQYSSPTSKKRVQPKHAMAPPPPSTKKELCKYFKSESCAKGDLCTFSHDLKLETCLFFLKGKCTLGENCKYSHDPSNSKPPPKFEE